MMLILGALATPSMAAGTYVLGGLVGAISGDPNYGWDGSYETAFRSAIQNTSNFGPTGTVTTTVTTTNVTSTANLTGIQGLVVPWWANGDASTTQVNQVVAFFHSGGDLLLAQDDPANSPVGTALGITTNQVLFDDSTEQWTPTGYFASGPFGALGANSVTSYYDVSDYLSTYGGTVGATDSGGNTLLYWPKHTFCSTCGALVVEGDVDVFATGATFSPLNANGIFSLDMVAYLVQNGGAFTNPATPTTPAPATFWLTLVGLLAAALYLGSRSRRTVN